MVEPRLACLLPAAGGSERLGQPKQLLELDGEALVVRSARLLLEQSDEVTVVTGACAGQVEDALRELPVRLVHNRGWESGMGGSIAAGVRAIGDGPDGILVMLCDQWRITAGDLERLVGTWRTAPDHVAAARFGDSFGPPLVLPRRLFGSLSDLQGDTGARYLVKGDAEVTYIDTPNAGFDLDHAGHLEKLPGSSG